MSLAQWTLATLKAAIIDYMEDDSTEFDTWAGGIGIGLGELRLLKDLDLEQFDEVDTSVTLVNGTPTFTKVTGTVTIRELWYTPVGGGAHTLILPRSQGYIKAYAPTTATTGAPEFWCEETETTVRLAPTPDAAYPLVQRIMKRPSGLATDTSGTYLSQYFADSLFFACMVEAEQYLIEEDRADSVWEKKYMASLPPHARERALQFRRQYKPVRSTPRPTGNQED